MGVTRLTASPKARLVKRLIRVALCSAVDHGIVPRASSTRDARLYDCTHTIKTVN